MRKKQSKYIRDGFSGFLRRYRWRIIGLSLLTMLQSLLQVSVATLSRSVIDAALYANGNLLLWGVVLGATILSLVSVHAILSWFTGQTSDFMSARLRQDMMRTAVFSRDEALLDHHSGELLSRGMEDVYTVCDGAVNVLPTFLGHITRLIATSIAVLIISPSVAVALLLIVVIVGCGTAAMRPAMRARQRYVRETDEKVMATMQEDLQQLELIQSIGAQEQILSRFGMTIEKSLVARFKRRLWAVGSNTIVSAASNIGSGVMLLWCAAGVAEKTLSYGSLTAMMQLVSLFRIPVLTLSGTLSRLASIEVAAERLWGLLKPATPARERSDISYVKAVVFEDVTFAYPGEETNVLQNFNFCFNLDGWTCLTGISGRGKTTMFKLILGLYSPQKGRIYLQTDAGEIPCTESVRNLFAYVPQDYALFSGTILENLLLVVPNADENALRRALSIAQADFVWDLTDELETQVGENNAGLSKGQLQRLAIARAVLMERPIFLLDECTSALDAGTEDAVLRGLHNLGKHAIVVTHRPDALQGLEDITPVSLER